MPKKEKTNIVSQLLFFRKPIHTKHAIFRDTQTAGGLVNLPIPLLFILFFSIQHQIDYE